MLEVVQSKQFKKSFKRIRSHKNFKENVFHFVIDELRNDRQLEAKYKDHQLVGDHIGQRECHVQNDILLIYEKRKDVLVLLLADIGSHSELF